MSVQADHLNALTARHPECRTAAYADIDTGIVLLVSADSAARTREQVDSLCAEAAVYLGSAQTPPLGTKLCTEALTASKGEMNVFIRDPNNPGEAYLFQCGTALDLAVFLEDARTEIASGAGQ